MTSPIKLGPLWNRSVFDPTARRIKRGMRTVCRFEEVERLRLREYFNRDEEEQLFNMHPEVQKKPRDAELWVDRKDGSPACVATLDRAGLLLHYASEIASWIGVPISTERLAIGDKNSHAA
jgi:hypothetical protein